MSYSAGEALLLTRVQACTGFSSTNTARAKWGLLDSGASDHYAILKAGRTDITWITLKDYQVTYRTIVQVWQRYVDDGVTSTNLYGYVANLFAILSYPHLAGGLVDSTIESISEVQERWKAGSDGPQWLMQEIEVSWVEQTEVSFAE